MTGQTLPISTNRNTSTLKKGSREVKEEEEQQNSNGGTRSITAIQMPWTLDALGHMPCSQMKKSDKESKADSAFSVIKRDISPGSVLKNTLESPRPLCPTPQSSWSKHQDQLARPRRCKH